MAGQWPSDDGSAPFQSEGVPEKPVSPEVLQLEEEKKLSDHIISLQQERYVRTYSAEPPHVYALLAFFCQ